MGPCPHQQVKVANSGQHLYSKEILWNFKLSQPLDHVEISVQRCFRNRLLVQYIIEIVARAPISAFSPSHSSLLSWEVFLTKRNPDFQSLRGTVQHRKSMPWLYSMPVNVQDRCYGICLRFLQQIYIAGHQRSPTYQKQCLRTPSESSSYVRFIFGAETSASNFRVVFEHTFQSGMKLDTMFHHLCQFLCSSLTNHNCSSVNGRRRRTVIGKIITYYVHYFVFWSLASFDQLARSLRLLNRSNRLLASFSSLSMQGTFAVYRIGFFHSKIKIETKQKSKHIWLLTFDLPWSMVLIGRYL